MQTFKFANFWFSKSQNQSPFECPLQTLVRSLLNRIRYEMVNGRAHKSNFCICTAVEEQYLLLVFIRLHGKRLTIRRFARHFGRVSRISFKTGECTNSMTLSGRNGGRIPAVVFDAKQSCLVDLEKIKTFQSTETRVTCPVAILFSTQILSLHNTWSKTRQLFGILALLPSAYAAANASTGATTPGDQRAMQHGS